MDDNRLDAAIDDTARRMTAGEPHADFRDRVLDRIAGARSPVWRPAVAGLALAASLVIAVVVFRNPTLHESRGAGSPQAGPPAIGAQADASQSSGAAVRPDTTDSARPTDRLRAGAGVTRDTVAGARASRKGVPFAASDALSVFEIEPLVKTAIDIPQIAVSALPANESLEIAPLQPAAPIAVAPLGPEDQGDRR